MLNRLAAAIISVCLVIVGAGQAMAFAAPSGSAHALASLHAAPDARQLAGVVLVSASGALCCTLIKETATMWRGPHCSVDFTCFLGPSVLFAAPATAPVGLPRFDRAAKGLAAGAPERPPRLIA